MAIKTDNLGFKFYDLLPGSFVLAHPSDFFKEVLLRDDEDNIVDVVFQPKVDHAFLVQSFHDQKFHAFRVKQNFDPAKLAPWFEAKKVFIHSPKHPASNKKMLVHEPSLNC